MELKAIEKERDRDGMNVRRKRNAQQIILFASGRCVGIITICIIFATISSVVNLITNIMVDIQYSFVSHKYDFCTEIRSKWFDVYAFWIAFHALTANDLTNVLLSCFNEGLK